MAAPNDYFTTPRKGTSLAAALTAQDQPALTKPQVGGLSAQLGQGHDQGMQAPQQADPRHDPQIQAAVQQLAEVRAYLQHRERTGIAGGDPQRGPA